MKHLIVDTPNLLWRVAAVQKFGAGGTPEDDAGLALHIALNTLKSHYNKVKPDVLALTFEGRRNWRKDYTRSAECISKRVYKANRIKNDTMLPFIELINSFEELVRDHTGIICLSNPVCEGDDLFAGYIERFTAEGDEVIGLSGDKDFISLLKFPNFTLLNPDKAGADRNKDKNGNPIDPIYFMFEKAFRGDIGDNVLSAFPRVRSTRLKKAYIDEYELTNLMNERWTLNEPSTGEERNFRVGDLFEENQLLMNLEKQPDWVRAEMFKTIDYEIKNPGKFSLFHFQKFVGKWNLHRIGDDAHNFIDLFSGKRKESKKPVLIF